MSDSEEKQKKVYDHLFKVLLAGDAKVGKSSIKGRYADGAFSDRYRMSSGIDFAVKNITVNEQKVKLHIWDTPGDERYRDTGNSYYRTVHAVIIMFDVTDQLSFDHVPDWHAKAKELCPEVFIFLVGNKSDTKGERKVILSDAVGLAKKLEISYTETSAKDNINVNDVFTCISKKLIDSKSADRRPRAWWNKK